jgi:TolB-like protein
VLVLPPGGIADETTGDLAHALGVELVHALAQIDEVGVLSRMASSTIDVDRADQLSEDLSAEWVVESDLRRVEGGVRVVVDVVDFSDGVVRWSRAWNRAEGFDFVPAIAREVSGALRSILG